MKCAVDKDRERTSKGPRPPERAAPFPAPGVSVAPSKPVRARYLVPRAFRAYRRPREQIHGASHALSSNLVQQGALPSSSCPSSSSSSPFLSGSNLAPTATNTGLLPAPYHTNLTQITKGPDEGGDGGGGGGGSRRPRGPGAAAPTARRDCTQVAEALGVSPAGSADSPGSFGGGTGDKGESVGWGMAGWGGGGRAKEPITRTRRLGDEPGAGLPGGGGENAWSRWSHLSRWLGAGAQDPDSWRR